MSEKENHFTIRDERAEEGFLEYWADKGNFKKFSDFVNKRDKTISDVGISYRKMNHWEEAKILPDGITREGDGWRKFNKIELIWIHILVRLRMFGLPLPLILKTKKGVIKWEKEKDIYPVFEFYIVRAWINADDIYVVVFPDGTAEMASTEEIEKSKMFYGSKDMLLISIKSILTKMGFNTKNPNRLVDLNREEKELLFSIRGENNSEIKIKLSDNLIKEIESTENISDIPSHKVLSDSKEKRIYGEVITKFEDGEQKVVKITKKQKFNRK